ncbi:MAG: hypothetical protein E4G95_03735 [Bacteroidia bacterium]|nr:MAG: hypothetical protein E4G95_03735 [Bacteroidia bacterium]
MKTFNLFLVLIMVLPILSCNAQTDSKVAIAQDKSDDNIEVYYFHLTTRCVTCKTIEAQAMENLEALYPGQMNEGLITFSSLNIEEEEGRAIADKLGVSGQTLLLVKGDQKINLTNEGFMYAVAKPEKFREIIKEKVDGLLTD